ncbi:MAG: hypothetical protein ACLQT6_09800 [Desulfomonilaceae bacterium]
MLGSKGFKEVKNRIFTLKNASEPHSINDAAYYRAQWDRYKEFGVDSLREELNKKSIHFVKLQSQQGDGTNRPLVTIVLRSVNSNKDFWLRTLLSIVDNRPSYPVRIILLSDPVELLDLWDTTIAQVVQFAGCSADVDEIDCLISMARAIPTEYVCYLKGELYSY